MPLKYEAAGRDEIYVRPFPNVNEGRWQVSTTGGTRPVWARTGRELFYLADDGLMSVAVTVEPVFRTAPPSKMFDVRGYLSGANLNRTYDVSLDGRRFLMIKTGLTAAADGPRPPSINVVLNWDEELKRLVPVN